MKLLPTLAALALVAILVGFAQHRELASLRQRSAELADDEIAPTRPGEHHPVATPPRKASGVDVPNTEPPEAPATLEASKLPTALAANEFIRHAEELIKTGSRLQVASALVPELNKASPELLKAVLAQIDTADIPPEAMQMAYSTILSKLVKTEPRAAIAMTLSTSSRVGEPNGSSIFRKVLQSWVANDPAAVEVWFEEAQKTGAIPSEPAELYNIAASEIVGIVARRDLAAAWQLIEAEAGNLRAQTVMLSNARESIASSADWERMMELARNSEDGKLRGAAAWMLAEPNFKHGLPTEQIARAEVLVNADPKLATIYAQNAIEQAGASGSAELAEWAIPRLDPKQVEGQVKHHIGQWAKRDREAVETWAESITDETLRATVQAALAP